MRLSLTSRQAARFAEFKAAYLPEAVRSCAGFQDSIRASLAELAALAEPRACETRRRHFGLPLDADAFRERILWEDGEQVVLGGIRFRNGKPDFPFVQATANFDALDAPHRARIPALAKEAFAPFAPKGLLVEGPPGLDIPGGEPWGHLLAGSLAATRATPLPSGLAAEAPAHVDFYEDYKAAYAEWRRRDPFLGAFVRAEARGDLQAAAAAGRLVSLRDPAGWCGVAAASAATLYGLPALYIFEIFIAERWRGCGVGSALDGLLVARAANGVSMVWEHIHSGNLPSLRVAFSQGRGVLETECFRRFS